MSYTILIEVEPANILRKVTSALEKWEAEILPLRQLELEFQEASSAYSLAFSRVFVGYMAIMGYGNQIDPPKQFLDLHLNIAKNAVSNYQLTSADVVGIEEYYSGKTFEQIKKNSLDWPDQIKDWKEQTKIRTAQLEAQPKPGSIVEIPRNKKCFWKFW